MRSRDGWSAGVFRASKLNHEPSASGPSAISQPMARKPSQMRSIVVVIGCRAPTGARVGGQRDVDGFLDEHPGVALGLELGLPRGERAADLAARRADALAGGGAGGRRQRLDLAIGERDRRAVTDVREPGGLQLVQVTGGRERGERVGDVAVQLVGGQGGHLDRVEILGGHASAVLHRGGVGGGCGPPVRQGVARSRTATQTRGEAAASRAAKRPRRRTRTAAGTRTSLSSAVHRPSRTPTPPRRARRSARPARAACRGCRARRPGRGRGRRSGRRRGPWTAGGRW